MSNLIFEEWYKLWIGYIVGIIFCIQCLNPFDIAENSLFLNLQVFVATLRSVYRRRSVPTSPLARSNVVALAKKYLLGSYRKLQEHYVVKFGGQQNNCSQDPPRSQNFNITTLQ